MTSVATVTRRLERVFEPEQAKVLAEVIDESYSDLVKTGDFNELKGLVAEIAHAQRDLQINMAELQEGQQALRESQQAMQESIRDLAVTVKGLSQEMGDVKGTLKGLSQEVSDVKGTLRGVAQEVGGLSRSMSYSLENEAYRMLPVYLEREYGIRVTERFVRTEIGGEEINFFARGERNGKPICLVGESKLRIDERRREAKRLFAQLHKQVTVVGETLPDCGEIVSFMVTHYIRPIAYHVANEENILIIHTFDW